MHWHFYACVLFSIKLMFDILQLFYVFLWFIRRVDVKHFQWSKNYFRCVLWQNCLSLRRDYQTYTIYSECYRAGIYLLKVNNKKTRTRCEICSKLTTHLHGWFSLFLNCTNGNKSRKASHTEGSVRKWFKLVRFDRSDLV